MARTKKNKKEKDETLIKLLKVFGLFMHVVGVYVYVIVLTTVTLSSIGVLESRGADLTNILNSLSMTMFTQITVFMAITLIYEVVNYVLYIYESDRILLVAMIIEAATFAFIGILWSFSLVSMYIMVVPVITALINYCILLLKNEEE